jgi:TIR domain
MPVAIFLSHSTRDDATVAALRAALESYGVSIWADSQRLSAGEELIPRIQEAIANAHHFVVLVSPRAVRTAGGGRADMVPGALRHVAECAIPAPGACGGSRAATLGPGVICRADGVPHHAKTPWRPRGAPGAQFHWPQPRLADLRAPAV